MTIVMIIVAILFLIIDIGRTRIGFIKTIFNQYFNPLMRRHELNGKLTGAT